MTSLIFKRLKSRRSQNVITVLSVFVCIAVVFFLALLWRSFSEGLEISSARLGADLVVVPRDAGIPAETILYSGAPANIYMSAEIAGKAKALPGVKQVTSQFFAYTLSDDCCDVGLHNRLVGFEPESDWVIKPWLATHNLQTLTDDEIILGSAVFANNQQRITVLGKSFRIAGILEETGTSLDRSLMINLAEARRLVGHNEAVPLQSLWEKEGPPEGLVSAVLVKTDGREDIRYITQKFKDMGNVDIIIASDMIKKIGSQYQRILAILEALALLIVTGTLVQLFLRFYSSSFEQRQEWGLYQALGAKGYQIASLVVAEAIILTGTGAVLGLFGGYSLFCYIERLYVKSQDFPFLEPSTEYYMLVGLALLTASLVLGGLAASIPAYRSSRIDPGTVMLRGEYD